MRAPGKTFTPFEDFISFRVLSPHVNARMPSISPLDLYMRLGTDGPGLCIGITRQTPVQLRALADNIEAAQAELDALLDANAPSPQPTQEA